jgi:hypothetical protein
VTWSVDWPWHADTLVRGCAECCGRPTGLEHTTKGGKGRAVLDISEAEMTEARDWTSDCLGLTGGQKVSPGRAVAYVERHYPGGWEAFTLECVASAVRL